GARIAKAADRSEHVLFMAHRRELIEQSSRKLHDTGVDHGIIQAGYPPRLGEPAKIASIATRHARAVRPCKIELPPANLLIIYECHHLHAVSYMWPVEAYPNAIVLGLRA